MKLSTAGPNIVVKNIDMHDTLIENLPICIEACRVLYA